MAYKVKRTAGRVAYFEKPGRDNVPEIVQLIKQLLTRRKELRKCKIVVFTAHGAGAYAAYTKLSTFAPKIIAVTFPRTFAMKRGEEWFTPTVNSDMRRFFDLAGVKVFTPQSLPFDNIAGMDGHNQAMRMARDTISLFGAGFTMCIQAVLRACDEGLVESGEFVIAFSADTAALIKASPTMCFLSPGVGLEVAEILCKTQSVTLPKPDTSLLLEESASDAL